MGESGFPHQGSEHDVKAGLPPTGLTVYLEESTPNAMTEMHLSRVRAGQHKEREAISA